MKRFALLALMIASAASAASVKPSIVLVHGAFADASSWSKVIPILQKDGYRKTATTSPPFRSRSPRCPTMSQSPNE
jgi:pimeloyl-ACP methyl ester carboxylesterase